MLEQDVEQREECYCDCHDDYRIVAHRVTCCDRCNFCHKRVRRGEMENHSSQCVVKKMLQKETDFRLKTKAGW